MNINYIKIYNAKENFKDSFINSKHDVAHMHQELVLNYDFDSHAVSFANIRRIIGSFPYGHPRRIGFMLLALTGMRLSIMVNIGSENFDGNIITFRCGKNQKGKPRRIALPDKFMQELYWHLERNPHTDKRYFTFSSNSFQREWHKLRYILGAPFTWKRPVKVGWRRAEYIVQIKGIRKTYMTKRYWELTPKYGKEGAVHVVAAEMRHSSVMITMAHYLKELENPEIYDELVKYQDRPIADIVLAPSQEYLCKYLPEQKKIIQYDEGSAAKPRYHNPA